MQESLHWERSKKGNNDDVASKGLDISFVDIVINYDVPLNPKDYVHQEERTARVGQSRMSISIVIQYDIGLYQKIKMMIDKKLDEHTVSRGFAISLYDNVNEILRMAVIRLKKEQKTLDKKKKGGIAKKSQVQKEQTKKHSFNNK